MRNPIFADLRCIELFRDWLLDMTYLPTMLDLSWCVLAASGEAQMQYRMMMETLENDDLASDVRHLSMVLNTKIVSKFIKELSMQRDLVKHLDLSGNTISNEGMDSLIDEVTEMLSSHTKDRKFK